MTTPAERYQTYLETLTVESLSTLGDYVTDDVRFKDPFNDVRGVDAMRRVFVHMFETLGDVKFTIHSTAQDGTVCFWAWHFDATLFDKPWHFEGTSVLQFDADGRVTSHIDHWDAATAFYEKLPVIGWLLARIRRRIAIQHR